MSDAHAALLADLGSGALTAEHYARMLELLRGGPASAARLVEGALERRPEGGTWFDLSLSFLAVEDFPRIIERALDALRGGAECEAARSVIAHAGLQAPSALHPHLEALFTLRPNQDCYDERWPWRESGARARSHLLEVIGSDAADDDRLRAWRCLLESRSGESLAAAMRSANRVPLSAPVSDYLKEVGFETPERRLYATAVSHLLFPDGYVADDRPIWNHPSTHPTWGLGGGGVACRFGGETQGRCGLCAGALHHLVTLPRTVFPFAVSAPEVALATCLSCLGWEAPTLSYRHDAEGRPRGADQGQVSPRFPAVPLQETTARLVPTPERWRWQDWGFSNARENLNRVGGHACWVQSAQYPQCPSCHEVMPFLLQLDSSLPPQDGGEWLWGSGGVCYAFWCSGCSVSTMSWQCT